MQITLRRANKLRVKLEARLNEVTNLLGNPTLNVSIHAENISQKVEGVREAYLKTLARHGSLNNVLTTLRKDIAKANVEFGVSDMLTQTAGLQRERRVLRNVEGASFAPSAAEIQSEVDTEKRNSSVGYGRNNTVMFGVMTEAIVTEAAKRLREIDLELAALEDMREGLNAKSRIELDSQSESILKAESLL
jgi:hypothetical protein